MSNHVGLRPRFIPLKGSSLRRLPQNITPLSVGFAVINSLVAVVITESDAGAVQQILVPDKNRCREGVRELHAGLCRGISVKPGFPVPGSASLTQRWPAKLRPVTSSSPAMVLESPLTKPPLINQLLSFAAFV